MSRATGTRRKKARAFLIVSVSTVVEHRNCKPKDQGVTGRERMMPPVFAPLAQGLKAKLIILKSRVPILLQVLEETKCLKRKHVISC